MLTNFVYRIHAEKRKNYWQRKKAVVFSVTYQGFKSDTSRILSSLLFINKFIHSEKVVFVWEELGMYYVLFWISIFLFLMVHIVKNRTISKVSLTNRTIFKIYIWWTD